jgi:hypothetical protein
MANEWTDLWLETATGIRAFLSVWSHSLPMRISLGGWQAIVVSWVRMRTDDGRCRMVCRNGQFRRKDRNHKNMQNWLKRIQLRMHLS